MSGIAKYCEYHSRQMKRTRQRRECKKTLRWEQDGILEEHQELDSVSRAEQQGGERGATAAAAPGSQDWAGVIRHC